MKTGYLDIWEPATLTVKRGGYSIKCSGPSGVVVTEKFSSSTIVCISYLYFLMFHHIYRPSPHVHLLDKRERERELLFKIFGKACRMSYLQKLAF